MFARPVVREMRMVVSGTSLSFEQPVYATKDDLHTDYRLQRIVVLYLVNDHWVSKPIFGLGLAQSAIIYLLRIFAAYQALVSLITKRVRSANYTLPIKTVSRRFCERS